MDERKLEILQEIHKHIESATALAMTEFDIRQKDSIQRKTGVHLEDALMPVEQALQKVLALYDLPTLRESEEVQRMYDTGESTDSIDKFEMKMDESIRERKSIQLNPKS